LSGNEVANFTNNMEIKKARPIKTLKNVYFS
jgi:hypothetical protein